MTESFTVQPSQSRNHEPSPSSFNEQSEMNNSIEVSSNASIGLDVDIREEIRDQVSSQGTGTQTVEPISDSNENPVQLQAQAEEDISQSSPTVTLVIQALITMMRCVLYFWFSFFWSTFTNHMPTRQLYTVSVILLSIHLILQKLFECLPRVLQTIVYYVGVEDIMQELNARNYSTSKLSPEVAFIEKMMEGFVSPNTVGKLATVVSSTISTQSETEKEGTAALSIVKLLETPIVSIMLPTAILSVFLLLTMSLFLCMHVVFQFLMGISSYMTGSSRPSTFSGFFSSFIVWGILGMLLLETILPVICLSIGIYLSFSIGGVMWSSFIGIACCTAIFFKYSRRAIYQGLQDAHRNVND